MTDREHLRYKLRTIKATGNIMAPILLERAHDAVDRLGDLLAGSPGVNVDRVHEIAKKLIVSWPTDDELNEIAVSTEFILAALTLVKTSLEGWVMSLPDVTEEDFRAKPDETIN